MFPRFTGENLEKNKSLYGKLADLAENHGCTTPQLALAWLLHQGDDIVPIPGLFNYLIYFLLSHRHVIGLFSFWFDVFVFLIHLGMEKLILFFVNL
jgi:hypothetical protein